MKFTLASLVLAAAATVVADPLPSPQTPTEVNADALVARERLLLRPAWRPATRTLHLSNGPLRRGQNSRQRTRAEEGKVAFRHSSARRNANANAAAAPGAVAGDLSAVPIHIDYSADHHHVNMPFPLAVHANYHKTGHVKRQAGQNDADPDQEDNWDCEEEGDGTAQSSSQPSDQGFAAAVTTNPMASFVAPSPSPVPEASSESSSSADASAQASQSAPSDSAAPDTQQDSSASASAWQASAQDAPAASSSSPAPSSASLAAQSAPTQDPAGLLPGSSGVEQGCTRFHTVVSGEICLGIINYPENVGLTLDQLYSWNPAINSECTNLAIGQVLCVSES